MSDNQRIRYDVFSIREYIQDRQIRYKWIKMGYAFQNTDGSHNINLWALPLPDPKTGMVKLHMRLPLPQEVQAQAPFSSQQQEALPSDDIVDTSNIEIPIDPIHGAKLEDL